ncbi:MAG TPA: hypothetical protein VHA82_24465 [Ramlibacter sp.]|uniref:hypothetical protein n=1 Tax=Ramlibacter sp. TaxID=1917967 RepID=UPI002C5C9AB5|nr:hypothetical protein [Ramlibacter sp.]HVZ46984.1 hypothetical protein [Ramlibacter sp.]
MTTKPSVTIRCGALAAALAALAAVPCAFAQPGPRATTAPGPELHAPWMSGPLRHDSMFLAASELERERIVKDAPYCADAVHEHVQTLADGNRIVQREQTRLCRDGQGRTRQEIASGARRKVFLNDPVAREAWLLEPEAKTAVRLDGMRHARGPDVDSGAIEHLREWAREMREWGHAVGERMRAQFGRPPDSPLPAAAERTDASPQPVRIVIGGPQFAEFLPPPPPMGAMPPMIAFQARLHAPRGPGSVTALPAETIEGLRAEGKRTTWTVEAGRFGNEKPLVTVREVWTSPELLVTLRSRESDPLAGEDSYRVQNLVRGEPDTALLRVPADYARIEPPALPMGPRKRP